ncbi:MAG: T9SS type A sorting domain-containing protein [Bacteroidales bacterium]|jgi:hypothetical protein|nr:T9SS type A sorting domain-containing protein [Bacteroidales bacterium]
MNSNRYLKKSLMLMGMLLLFNTVIAQDRITFSWHGSHGGSLTSGNFVIKATNGEQFTIDWGDSIIETKTGLGDAKICLMHEYVYGQQKSTVTITASNANCKFTYFHLDTYDYGVDAMLCFQMYSLTLEGCSDLNYFFCENNSLQLSDLYAAHLIINEREAKLFGRQYLPIRFLRGDRTVDFSAQRIFGGVETGFAVWKRGENGDVGNAAILNVDYTIDSGVISFINNGHYLVTMGNDAIISHPDYPASVLAEFYVKDVGIFEHALPNTRIYPNPTGNIVYIETENETIPEVKIYSLDGRLLQQIRNKEIDLSTYSAGVYFLSISGKMVKIIRK